MSRKKILLVDDEKDFLQQVKFRLEAEGYEVCPVKEGETALKKLDSIRPVAVLLDIRMPGMDGLEVLKKMRQKDKQLPIFMLSAYPDSGHFEKAKEQGASGFLVKAAELELQMDQILAAIHLVSKGKETRR